MKFFLLNLLMMSILLSYGQGDGPDSVSFYKKHRDPAAQYAKGLRYYRNEDYKNALVYFGLSADHQYPAAYYMIAEIYLYGSKVEQDFPKALKYFHQAADLGNTDAMVSIGYMYEKGLGLDIDLVEGQRWYRMAGRGHNYVGLANIGFYFLDGLGGLPRSDDSAFVFFREAADSGYSRAQLQLGYMYEVGHGIRSDPMQAEKWYRKAAEQGNSIALCNLGIIYSNGLGSIQANDSLARYYYMKSAALGNARGQFNVGYMYHYGAYGEKVDTDRALLWYDASAQQHNGDALNNYAWLCYAKRINLTRATRYSREALDLRPGSIYRLDTYGALLFLREEYQDAEKYQKMCIDSGGYDKPDYLERYGDTLSKLGRKEDALKYWKKAAELPYHSAILARKIELGQYVE
jgi:TPR repeat protein